MQNGEEWEKTKRGVSGGLAVFETKYFPPPSLTTLLTSFSYDKPELYFS